MTRLTSRKQRQWLWMVSLLCFQPVSAADRSRKRPSGNGVSGQAWRRPGHRRSARLPTGWLPSRKPCHGMQLDFDLAPNFARSQYHDQRAREDVAGRSFTIAPSASPLSYCSVLSSGTLDDSVAHNSGRTLRPGSLPGGESIQLDDGRVRLRVLHLRDQVVAAGGD